MARKPILELFFLLLGDFFPIFRVRPKSIFRSFFPISGRRPEIGILPGMGEWKKEGGGNLMWHPSQKGVLDPPPSYGTFSTPLRCQCSVFPVQQFTTEQTRSSFGGVQKFSGERVLWYVFPPIRFAPPISRPKIALLLFGFSSF